MESGRGRFPLPPREVNSRGPTLFPYGNRLLPPPAAAGAAGPDRFDTIFGLLLPVGLNLEKFF
jgi:hypothetical protein